MCGLVGMAGNCAGMNSFMETLLHVDGLRGMDSTGVAKLFKHTVSEPTVHKSVGTVNDLFTFDPSLRKGLTGSYKLVLGHNRAATVGGVSDETAHPFQYGHITGAHNGTLMQWRQTLNNGNNKEFDSDSQAVFSSIAEHGIDETWRNLNGAAALSYYDQNEKALYFIRNNRRPLFFLKNEEKDVLMWASEWPMISFASQRHNIKLNRSDSGKLYVQEARPDILYKFDISKTGELDGYEHREVKPYETPKKVVTTTQTTSGTKSGINTARNKPTKTFHDSFKGPFRRKGLKRTKRMYSTINVGWADGLPRTDADFRGMTGEVTASYNGGDEVFYRARLFKPYTFGGREYSVVYIYPVSEDETQKLLVHMTKGGKEVEFCAKARISKEDDKLKVASSSVLLLTRPDEAKKEETKQDQKTTGKVLNLKDEIKKLHAKNETSTLYFLNINPYEGLSLTKDEWYDAVKRLTGGTECSQCGNPLDVEDGHSIVWPTNSVCVCPACQKNYNMSEYIQ